MEEYLKSLQGISYPEWIRLKAGIDKTFEQQKGEFERQLKFTNSEKAKQLIRSQFG